MSDFRVDRVGYYRRRDGGVAYVGALAPFGASFSATGWVSWDGWKHWGWTFAGKTFTGRRHECDLVSYIGETLRKLPDSPGWWWYEYSETHAAPALVCEAGGKFISHGGRGVEEVTGRWGDKIEPSGFEPAELATGTAQGTDARKEAKP